MWTQIYLQAFSKKYVIPIPGKTSPHLFLETQYVLPLPGMASRSSTFTQFSLLPTLTSETTLSSAVQ